MVNLLGEYCHLIDRGTPEEMVALFTDDATLERARGPAVGRKEIRAHFEEYFKNCESVVWVRHRLSSPFVTLHSETEASAVSLFDADTLWPTGSVTTMVGRWEDEVVLVDGRWRFQIRRIISEGFYEIGQMPIE